MPIKLFLNLTGENEKKIPSKNSFHSILIILKKSKENSGGDGEGGVGGCDY